MSNGTKKIMEIYKVGNGIIISTPLNVFEGDKEEEWQDWYLDTDDTRQMKEFLYEIQEACNMSPRFKIQKICKGGK